MRVIDRYLVRGFLWALAYCVALFSMLFIVIDTFNNLDDFLKNAVPAKVVLSYYAYYLPAIFVQIIPAATLVALLYTLGNFSKHNEIVAMKSGGMSVSRTVLPYVFLAALISFSVLYLNETLVPDSLVTSTSIKQGLMDKGKKSHNRAIKNVAAYGQDNRMIYAREYEIATQTLHDVVILEDNLNHTLKSKLMAKKAEYREGRWLLHDVIRYRLDAKGDIFGEPTIAPTMTLEIPEKPDAFVKDGSRVDLMNSRELHNHIRNLRGSGEKMLQRLLVDFHYKTAMPFVTFVLVLIGTPLGMRTERSGLLVGVGTSLLIVLSFYALLSVSLALGKGGFLPPLFAAWFANVSFSLAGIYLIRHSG